jgi:hypothetical protein
MGEMRLSPFPLSYIKGALMKAPENLTKLSPEQIELIITCLRFTNHSCRMVLGKEEKINELVDTLNRSEAYVTA